jgi:hypothetical protein
MGLRRFLVADRSMEPALHDGDGVLAIRPWRARPGQLRCLEHPARPGFWLVKRVADVAEDGTMWVVADNRAAGGVDSLTFGRVPASGSYRVLFRVPRRLL